MNRYFPIIKAVVLCLAATASLSFAAPRTGGGDRNGFPFLWVPNSGEGTISKVDIKTGEELGRFRTGPIGGGNPSRTTVDLQGNCWVGNRGTGSVVKVGLLENGQCRDRNGNGAIETSNGSTALPWGEDECVLFNVELDKGKESVWLPGSYRGAPNNSLPRGIAIDADNNLWAGTYNTMMYYRINGATGEIEQKIDLSSVGHHPYGAVVDQQGILWSSGYDSNAVLRLDTASGAFSPVKISHTSYGIGLDLTGHLFVSGWNSNKLSRIERSSAAVEWTIPTGDSGMRGVAVTADNDVWIANSNSNTVSRWSNDGARKAVIAGFNHPTGVAVDTEGKVWVVNFNDPYIFRIDPATNQVELKSKVGGSGHYGYSDMTGLVIRRVKARSGIEDAKPQGRTLDPLVVRHDGGPQPAAGRAQRTRQEPADPGKKQRNEIRKKLNFDME